MACSGSQALHCTTPPLPNGLSHTPQWLHRGMEADPTLLPLKHRKASTILCLFSLLFCPCSLLLFSASCLISLILSAERREILQGSLYLSPAISDKMDMILHLWIPLSSYLPSPFPLSPSPTHYHSLHTHIYCVHCGWSGRWGRPYTSHIQSFPTPTLPFQPPQAKRNTLQIPGLPTYLHLTTTTTTTSPSFSPCI